MIIPGPETLNKVLEAGYATDKQVEAIVTFVKYGSLSEAGRKIGVDHSSVRNRIRKAVNRYNKQNTGVPSPEGFEVVQLATTGVGDITSAKHRPIPTEPTPRPATHTISKLSQFLTNGEVTHEWVQSKPGEADRYEAFLRTTTEHLEKFQGFAGTSTNPKSLVMPDTCALYPIGDMHVGLYSWAEETGYDMDLKKIVQLGLDACATLVARTLPSETAYLINVGDFFHIDDHSSTTPKSHNQLDSSGRFDQILHAGYQLLQGMVEILRTKHQTIHVVNAKGNHDPKLTSALTAYMQAIYRDDSTVVVHPCTKPLQMFTFGKNLFGTHHGDGMPMAKIPGIVPVVAKQEWGMSEYCLVLTGHIHHKSKIEENGVCVESHNTLNVPDNWHATKGFIGSGRWFESVTLSKAGGECARGRVTVNSKGGLI